MLLPILLILLGAACLVGGVAYAWIGFSRTVAGVGHLSFSGEVTVTDIRPNASAGKISVWVTSNSKTVADKVYTVELYFVEGEDGYTLQDTITVSWDASKIPGTTIKVQFSGLTITEDTVIKVEVV